MNLFSLCSAVYRLFSEDTGKESLLGNEPEQQAQGRGDLAVESR